MFSVTRSREDISDRDLQKSEKQFSRCKSFDTYTPVGPFVYTEVEAGDLEISLRQNGEVKQQARTSQMIYSVAEIVSFASQSLTPLPGRFDPDGNAVRESARSGPATNWLRQVGDWPILRNRVENARLMIKKKSCQTQFTGLPLHPTVKVNPNSINDSGMKSPPQNESEKILLDARFISSVINNHIQT